jgi:cell division protein FtsN
VQLGAYASEGSALSLRDALVRSWPDARVQRAEVSGRTMWRVRVGNYATRRDADEAAKRLSASGYRAMVVEAGRP